jgi:hypothetical protein
MKRLDAELENLFDAYYRNVEAVILREFERTVKPYLQRRGLHMVTGNGTFYIYREIGGRNIDMSNDLPDLINNILHQDIPGLDGNDFGSLMPDFHPEEV